MKYLPYVVLILQFGDIYSRYWHALLKENIKAACCVFTFGRSHAKYHFLIQEWLSCLYLESMPFGLHTIRRTMSYRVEHNPFRYVYWQIA